MTLERRSRRGLSLLEVMVVIAIVLGLTIVLVPATSALLDLEERNNARQIAYTYAWLHDEAPLQNVTFRVGYHLDEGYWQVEVGRPDTLIFDDPEAREDYEQQLEDKLSRLTEREQKEQGAEDQQSAFQELQSRLQTKYTLPRGTKFKGVYTPQYGKLVEPSGDPEEPAVVYSYIFPNGFTEPAVIQLVDSNDEEDGFTVIVQPLSGRVEVKPEIIDADEAFAEVPDEGPELSE